MAELCQKWRKICQNAVFQSTAEQCVLDLSLYLGVVDNSDKGTSLHSWLNKNVNIAIT